MTENKKSPAFQFYPDDWLTDSAVAMMSPEQEGAYIRLVCYCWLDNDISLPDNDEQLSVLARLNKGGLELVKAKFKPHPTKNGFLTHSRLQKEYKKQVAWRKKSSKGGKKSAAQRAENKRKSKGGSNLAQPKANTPSPSPSPSPSVLEVKKEVYTQNFLDIWKVYPKTRIGNQEKAHSAYKNALKRDTEENINIGVQAYIDSEEALNYPKGLAAWFNDDKWKNNYKQKGKNNGKETPDEELARYLDRKRG